MLLRPLLENARTRPDAVAVIDDRGSTTWAELLSKSRKLAKVLRGKTRRDHVAILLPAGGGFVTCFYAGLLAGKVPVPLNFLLDAKQTGHVLADSGCDLVLSAKPVLERLDAGKAVQSAADAGRTNVMDLTAMKPTLGTVLAQLRRLPAPDHDEGDVATILYTSGTSGLPKGVVLTHGNLDSDAKACIAHSRLDRGPDGEGKPGEHVFLGVVPLFHSTGLLATMLAPVQLGATTVYTARFSPQQTAKKLREHGVTVMAAVPSMYNALARLKDAGPADVARLNLPLSGGEPLPGRVRESFRRKFDSDLMEGYGLTETCGPICINMPHAHRPGSVGRPIPGGEVLIVDDNGRPLPDGQTGEILMRGPMVFARYHNLPDATAAARTEDGYFRSGDLGHVDADGYLFVTGRKKDMLIVGGENVYPREIEEVLGQHESVGEAAVVGREDASRGEVPIAFVIAAEGHAVDESALRDFCRAQGLANFKIPKEVREVKELPRSPTGKVLKRELTDALAREANTKAMDDSNVGEALAV